MKYLGIYFTGTGNSKRVLETAKRYLESLGHEMDVVDVISQEQKDISAYDGLYIFYPIYGFNAPKPIIQYVKKISKQEKTLPCVIMKQSGEHLFWNNGSSLYLRSLLKRRHIQTVSEFHYLMPYSFIFRHSDYMAYRMKSVMEILVPMDINNVLNGQKAFPKRFFLDRFFAWVLRIQWWGGRFNGRFYKVEQDKCIKCLKCVRDCPAKNISFEDGKFKFGKKCLMCQRCIMYCPKKAIKVGMFNSWRVDEPYSFKETAFQEESHPKYCRKNYKKYFEASEKRINDC